MQKIYCDEKYPLRIHLRLTHIDLHASHKKSRSHYKFLLENKVFVIYQIPSSSLIVSVSSFQGMRMRLSGTNDIKFCSTNYVILHKSYSVLLEF